MADISTVPMEVNFFHYGGDTLTFTVTAPSALVEGMDWNGQVRAIATSDVVDAVFEITPPVVPDGPATVVLTAASCAALIENAVVVTKQVGLPGRAAPRIIEVKQYVGVWDVQISAAGLDPVTTLARGTLTIEADVTRLPDV